MDYLGSESGEAEERASEARSGGEAGFGKRNLKFENRVRYTPLETAGGGGGGVFSLCPSQYSPKNSAKGVCRTAKGGPKPLKGGCSRKSAGFK